MLKQGEKRLRTVLKQGEKRLRDPSGRQERGSETRQGGRKEAQNSVETRRKEPRTVLRRGERSPEQSQERRREAPRTVSGETERGTPNSVETRSKEVSQTVLRRGAKRCPKQQERDRHNEAQTAGERPAQRGTSAGTATWRTSAGTATWRTSAGERVPVYPGRVGGCRIPREVVPGVYALPTIPDSVHPWLYLTAVMSEEATSSLQSAARCRTTMPWALFLLASAGNSSLALLLSLSCYGSDGQDHPSFRDQFRRMDERSGVTRADGLLGRSRGADVRRGVIDVVPADVPTMLNVDVPTMTALTLSVPI